MIRRVRFSLSTAAIFLPRRSSFVWAAMAAPRSSFVWDMSPLLSEKGAAAISAFYQIVRRILAHDCFLDALNCILLMSRSAFKELSNQGFVYKQGRHVDLGNWRWNVLYQCLAMLSTKFNPDINERLTQISQLYPTLGRKAPPTPQSISMKGDVVEVALALCRETGHSIAKPKVIARHEFNHLFVQFEQAQEQLLVLTFTSHRGRPPLMAEFPDADLYAKSILAAYRIAHSNKHGSNDVSDATTAAQLIFDAFGPLNRSAALVGTWDSLQVLKN
jgi:hypothetical protein